MMAYILGNHPKVYTFIHEIHFFDELIDIKNLHKDIPEREAIRIYAYLLSIINEGYLSKKNIKHYIPETKQRTKGINKQTPANLYSDFLFYFTEKIKERFPVSRPRDIFFILGRYLRFSLKQGW